MKRMEHYTDKFHAESCFICDILTGIWHAAYGGAERIALEEHVSNKMAVISG